MGRKRITFLLSFPHGMECVDPLGLGSLNSNGFTGPIPAAIGNLSNFNNLPKLQHFSLKSRGIRFLGRDDESLAPIFTPPHSTTTPEAAGVCESGMGGLGDMKLIFGTTVVRKRGKAGKEDKFLKFWLKFNGFSRGASMYKGWGPTSLSPTRLMPLDFLKMHYLEQFSALDVSDNQYGIGYVLARATSLVPKRSSVTAAHVSGHGRYQKGECGEEGRKKEF
ncbi:hypothetical protein JHK85_028496 [Glycine max]|nr:hypothetical protein JHK85_028496 [Glycine max]